VPGCPGPHRAGRGSQGAAATAASLPTLTACSSSSASAPSSRTWVPARSAPAHAAATPPSGRWCGGPANPRCSSCRSPGGHQSGPARACTIRTPDCTSRATTSSPSVRPGERHVPAPAVPHSVSRAARPPGAWSGSPAAGSPAVRDAGRRAPVRPRRRHAHRTAASCSRARAPARTSTWKPNASAAAPSSGTYQRSRSAVAARRARAGRLWRVTTSTVTSRSRCTSRSSVSPRSVGGVTRGVASVRQPGAPTRRPEGSSHLTGMRAVQTTRSGGPPPEEETPAKVAVFTRRAGHRGRHTRDH
jgi:hypothetical protein